MHKTMIFFRILILNGLLMFCNQTYSQDMYATKLDWVSVDSLYDLSFSDTAEALEWSKNQIPFIFNDKQVLQKEVVVREKYRWDLNMMIANSSVIQIKGNNFYIVIADGCSGLPYQNFYVFQDMGVRWRLVAISQGRIIEKIELESTDDKIIFKTKSRIVGEFYGT